MEGYHARDGKSTRLQAHISRLGGAYAVSVLDRDGRLLESWPYHATDYPAEWVVDEGTVVYTVEGASSREIDQKFRYWVAKDIERQSRCPVWSPLNAVTRAATKGLFA